MKTNNSSADLRKALTESYKREEANRLGTTDFYGLFCELDRIYESKLYLNKIYIHIISCSFVEQLGTDIISPEHTVQNLAKAIDELDGTDRLAIAEYVPIDCLDANEIYEYLRETKNSLIVKDIKRFVKEFGKWNPIFETYMHR